MGLLVLLAISMIPQIVAGQTVPIIQRGGDDSKNPLGDRPDREQFDNRSYPADDISPAQQKASFDANFALTQQQSSRHGEWKGIGPIDPYVVGPVTYTGRPTYNSGRVTSLALSPKCQRDEDECRLFVGAAGGGIWTTENALDSEMEWRPSGHGVPTNAIGSIIFDPTDRSGKIGIPLFCWKTRDGSGPIPLQDRCRKSRLLLE